MSVWSWLGFEVLVTIYSLSAKGSLNRGAHSWFRCPFSWPSANQIFFPGFDFISSIQFPTVIWSISRGPSQCCSLNLEVSPSTLSKSFYFVKSACVYCLLRTRSICRLSQFSTGCSKSWYRTMDFRFTSFCCDYHQLWQSLWHAVLAFFFWYIFWFGNSVDVTCSR